MDDLEAAEAYRREAEFYKEKAEENIRYKYLYLRLGGEMYEVLEILRRTPCACAPLQEAESRLRQMLEQADEDDCQKGVYDFFRKRKAVHQLTSCKKSARIPLTVMKRSSTREDRPQESLWSGGKRRAGPGEYTAELAPKRPSAQ